MTSNSGQNQPRAPPKIPAQGRYDFVQYCPAWTDPDWQDEGPQREKSVFKIRDAIFDRLRPALLPRDQFQNPSTYAQRFSVFPGRTDGRSRTSPTRAESRLLFPANAEVKTGKQLFDRFEQLAQQAGEDVEEYMERTRPDLQSLSEVEQQYMQQYEDLIVDENWQAILFGSLTMDEIHAEGYFTMSNTEDSELSGPLYELFARDRWLDTRKFGDSKDWPRYMYTLDGQREEWDPRTNDRVWDAMQPALQLATRFLMLEDSFILGLQDITNRLLRKLKFVRDINPVDPTRVYGAKQLKDTGVDVWAANFEVLYQIFEIRLGSGFDFDGKAKQHISGRQRAPIFFNQGDKISVDIDCELVWPLIVDKYTKSEKLMASLTLATTLAHEMMHAFNTAAHKWIRDPSSVGITTSRQVVACNTLAGELIDPVHGDHYEEPYFENDASTEVGHAFETHVLGGGYWSWVHSSLSVTERPPLLQTAGGLVAHCTHPEGGLNWPPFLTRPYIRGFRINHFVRFEDVKKYFTNSFWNVSIHKYGTAALREPSKRPHKISYNPMDVAFTSVSYEDWNQIHLSSYDNMEWLFQYMRRVAADNYLLHSYLNNLVTEACDFDLMIVRFKDDQLAWDDRDKVWRDFGNEALMILCEFSAYFAQEFDPTKDNAVLLFLHGTWENAWNHLGRYPDYQSSLLANVLQQSVHEDWIDQVKRSTVESYERRLMPKLVDFVRACERELSHMESMICELYHMGITFWELYFYYAHGHIQVWRQRVADMVTLVQNLVAAFEFSDQRIKLIDGDWHQRALNLGQRADDIVRLLCLDETKYVDNWRDLLRTMPMLRKSNRKPHQRFYFLAKKEMMNLSDQQLQDLTEFKQRFHAILNLGGYKIALPGMDPDELAIAQRLSGTLDDGPGDNARDRTIKGPSTGIFNLDVVRKLAMRLDQDDRNAKDEKMNRIKGTLREKLPSLQKVATEQASEPPSIPPKFQHMSMGNQAVPVGNGQPFSTASSPFASYSSGTSSPFPSNQPGQPSAWKANSAADLAAWANGRLGNAPAAAHGIMPHPYAIRETVTEDLKNAATTSLPMRDPVTLANAYPRERVEGHGTPLGAGPLGDIDQLWQQQSQIDQNLPPAATSNLLVPPNTGDNDVDMVDFSEFIDFSGFANCVTAVSDFDYSSSDTDVSDIEERRKGYISETTLIETSDAESEQWSSGSSDALFSEKLEGPKTTQGLKRKSSWAPVDVKKRKLDIELKERRAKVVNEKARSWTWRDIIPGFGRSSGKIW
ncbi:hypothetical protein FGRMN_4064 [Fusarium graminum]|nr:hypothetical protein FGRMN_4064 [Fusarium graminum]